MLELRRIFGFLFIALYLAGSAQFTLAKHFCGGELVSVAFDAPISCCGDNEEDSGCCENEETVIAHEDHSYSLSKLVVKPSKLIGIWIPALIEANLAQVKSTCSFTPNRFYLHFKPPPIRWFILFRSLVI